MFRILRRLKSTVGTSVSPPIPVFGIEGRYVTALYSAAHQKKELESCEKSLAGLLKEMNKPKIVDFVETSLISRADKAKLMEDIASKAGMPSTAINFLAVVAENGRLKKLKRMITMFLAVMVAHRNEALCEVITAKPLDDNTRKTLLAVLSKLAKGKQIQLTERVDPSIIGGMVVGVEDKHIDMSISNKINFYTALLKQAF